MKRTVIILIVVLIFGLTGCTKFNPEKTGWDSPISKYVYEEIKGIQL